MKDFAIVGVGLARAMLESFTSSGVSLTFVCRATKLKEQGPVSAEIHAGHLFSIYKSVT